MQKNTNPKTILICGLGIIGGSLAKAIKAYTPHRVLGMNRSPETPSAGPGLWGH